MKKPVVSAAVEDAAVSLQYEVTSIVRERTGMNEIFASQLAEAIVTGMSARWGGERVYVPVLGKDFRNDEIRRAFDGTNRDELCRRFQISRSALYKIVGKRSLSNPT